MAWSRDCAQRAMRRARRWPTSLPQAGGMRAKDMLRPAAAASALAPFHFPVLVADIGGTNARFALLPDTESHMRVFADIATASYSSIEAAIEDAILPHADVRPHAAIVAGAGPVAD